MRQGAWFLVVAGLLVQGAVLAAECEKLSEVCVDGPATKTISGHPVYRDCWKYEARYNCLGSDLDTTECDELRNRGCGQISSTCVESSDSGCSLYESKFQCEAAPAKTATTADCGSQSFCLDGNCFDTGHPNDPDFARVVSYMEAMREAGMYMDEGNLTLFNGVPGTCSTKVFGLANCCKAKSSGAPSNFTAITAAVKAIGMGYDYARSMYNYDALFQSDAPGWLYRAFYGAGDPMFITPTFSVYGFSFALAGGAGAATLPTGSICVFCAEGAGFAIGFDPVSFAFSLALNFVISELLSCDQADQMVAMRKSNRLCVYLGSYCSKKFLGACLNKKQSYCCYNSRLARIINEQGRAQIGKGFGSPKAPNCTGFTPEELQSLDFAKMDLSEFYAEIQPKSLDMAAIKSAIENRVVNNPSKSYFGGNAP